MIMNDQIIDLQDSNQNRIDALKKSSGMTLLFAIIGISLSALYPLFSLLTTAVAAIPLPIIGLVISIVFFIIEIAMAGGAVFCSVFAIVRAIIFLVKNRDLGNSDDEKKARIFNIISLCLGACGVIIFFAGLIGVVILNMLEFILALI